MGSTIEDHVGKEIFLVYLTSLGTRNSDPNWNLVFDQIGQIVIRAVTGWCFIIQIPSGICPTNAIVDKENIGLVSLRMSDFGELKTPRCCLIVISAQNK